MSLQHRSAGSWSLAALLALIAGLLVVPTAASRADAPVPAQDALLVNGPNARVTAITHDAGSGQSYVAGDFTRWGPQTGGMGMVNNTTGALNTGFPAVRGFVRAAVPDGAGGFYIGGTFSHVGAVARNNAAHILADGTVDPNWDPNPVGDPNVWEGVVDMTRIGSDVILAGRFSLTGPSGDRVGVTRIGPDGNRVAGFTDALVAGGFVYSVATDGSSIYAGGQFDSINATSRGNGAQLDASTGALQSWDPQADGDSINAVELVGDAVVVGGDFNTLAGRDPYTVLNLGAFSTTDGSFKSAWIPAPDDRITAMAVEEGGQLYIAGDFSTVAGTSRSRAAGLGPDTDIAPVVSDWNPDVDGSAFSLQSSQSGVYLAGIFTQVGGQSVPGVARVTSDTGTLDAGWDPPDPVYSTSGGPEYVFVAIPLAGSQVLLGGTFIVMGGTAANRVAALDAGGNLINSFSVGSGPNGAVNAMTVAGGRLYLGGSFTQVNGQNRSRVAAVDPNTGSLDSWGASLSLDEEVRALASEGGELFIGGLFTTVDGSAREGIAGLSLADATLTNWGVSALSPADGALEVNALAATNVGGTRRVYVGGTFNRISGSNFAGLEGSDGIAITTVPSPDGPVRALSVTGERVYLAGSFANFDGVGAPNVAAVNTANDTREAWEGATNTTVQAITADADQVVVGGTFDAAFGLGVNGMGVGATDGNATGIPWNVQVPSFGDGETVRAMRLIPDPDTGVNQRVLIGTDTAVVDGSQLRFFYADVNSGIAAGPARDVRAVAGGGSGIIDLAWEAPSTLGPGIAEPVGYRIWSAGPPYTTWSLAVGDTADTVTSAVIEGLANSTRYRFRVAALTQQGGSTVLGGLSAPSNWAMPQNPAKRPSEPQNVTATGEPEGPGTGMIRVLADAPSSWGNGTVKGYRSIASVSGIAMGYCQDFGGDEPPTSLDCYIPGLTLGSDYDVVAKAVNSRNIWGPAAAANGGVPVDALSLEWPAVRSPGEDPAVGSPVTTAPDGLPSPSAATATPGQESQTPRTGPARSRAKLLRARVVKRGTVGRKKSVAVNVRVRPAQGRVVQLQRKVCSGGPSQRACVWRTVGQRRAKVSDSARVVLRAKGARSAPTLWRVFLPATASALPAVSRAIRR